MFDINELRESKSFKKFKDDVKNNQELVSLGANGLEEVWLVGAYALYKNSPKEMEHLLYETLKWRREYNYDNLLNEDFSHHYSKGKLYFFNKDVEGRLILIWRMNKHIASEHDHNETVRFIVYTICKGMADGILDGSLCLLIDRLDSSQKNIESLAFIRLLASILQNYFPIMLEKIVIFPSDIIISLLWKVAKKFLDRTVAERVAFIPKKNYVENLKKLIKEENLPMRHGGKAVDWTEALDM